MQKLLEINGLKSWYGLSQALFDVNLEINQGELLPFLVEMAWANQPQSDQFVV